MTRDLMWVILTKKSGKSKVSRAVNVSVELGGRIRSSEQLIRVFIRKCKEEGIVREYKKKLLHETKGQKKRRKKHEGKRRAKKKSEPTESTQDKSKRRKGNRQKR